uniref:Late blight resistance protein homolog R1A-3 n=1 Tax=Nicotiana tabacum TaxID=4097 RepID=A0A1S3X3F6_TOBAC
IRVIFHSGEWCLEDITFHKLKYLKLSYLKVSRWEASEEFFPQLETLVIKQCEYLEEIPLSFADIPTLKQIKLMWGKSNKSLTASAVRIKKEVEENEGPYRPHYCVVSQARACHNNMESIKPTFTLLGALVSWSN